MATLRKKFILSLILFTAVFSPIYCDDDSITFNKRDCLLIDQTKPNDIIISFDYSEGHYRAIHASYNYWVNDAVKLKYLGDSSKDIIMKCYIGTNYQTSISSSLLHYYIPCTLDNPGVINEGTYCVQIVKKLIGDISSEDYCIDSLAFKAIKTTNIPGLTVIGFSSEQSGCVRPGETVTLLATVQNMMSITQDFKNIGIFLANTETVVDNIPLQCKIEGQKSVGSGDKIICKIPDYISEGYYSILYSSDSLESQECPVNVINEFNSLNFNGQLKKLHIFQGGNNAIIPLWLRNISFPNQTEFPGLFNLTLSFNDIQNIDYYHFDNMVKKDIGIKLCDKSVQLIDTKCDFVKSDDSKSTFYLLCIPESFEIDTEYSLVILEDIIIGYDSSNALCTYDENTIYKNIIIYSAEYDFLIIFDENNSPYLDCNLNINGYLKNGIDRIKNHCGNCGSNCIICKNSNICSNCLQGFTLKNSGECEVVKDKISFDKFKEVLSYTPHEESCQDSEYNNQLFSFTFSYVVNKGENLAVESEQYNNVIFGKSQYETFGLKCKIDVNPEYAQSSQKSLGICKESTCTVNAYVNCSFHDSVSNGIYDIQVNSNNDFSNLISRAKANYEPIKIKFIVDKFSADMLNDTIKITYEGYLSKTKAIYACPEIKSDIYDCYQILDCKRLYYDEDSEQTIIECSKEVDYYEDSCQTFRRIMMEDNCGKNINESFSFRYCPDEASSFLYLENLYILLVLLLLII